MSLIVTVSPSPEAPPSSRLLQVGEYMLYGCVQSMEKVLLAHSKRETLLLSFRDAKVSKISFQSFCFLLSYYLGQYLTLLDDTIIINAYCMYM